MNKSIKTLAFAIVSVLLLGSITVLASSPHKLTFKDMNGDEIIVLEQNQQEVFKDKNIVANAILPDTEKVEIGQSIKVNGEEAIVFAIGEDGSYITVTPEIFNEFQKSNP